MNTLARQLRTLLFVLASSSAVLSLGATSQAWARSSAHTIASPTPTPQAQVIQLTTVPAARAAAILKPLFPRARVRVDRNANALIVYATLDDVQQMRTVAQGIDVRNPQQPVVEVLQLRSQKPEALIHRLTPLYRSARFEETSKTSILVRASPQDMAEIKTVVSALDVPPASPTPEPLAQDAIHVTFASPKALARALVRQNPQLRANVSGASILLAGSAEDIGRAKTLAQTLDVPPIDARYTQIYRLHTVDATSIGDLITRSYPNVTVKVDPDLNAISVFGTAADQQRIDTAIQQLDATSGSGQMGASNMGAAAVGDGNVDVVNLKSAIPGTGGAPSTTATDIAQAVQQSLSSLAPDLRLTPLNNTAQIVIAGNPQSIRLAAALIHRLDVAQPLVVLDTEVLEVDENVTKNLGLEIPGGFISAIYSEVQPTPDPFTGQAGRIGRFQALTRTPLSFTALVNFLIQNGNGRVLADPRVTTVSGRDATITAGDTINVLTQTGGGITPITQQLQSFQTGVSLDITPIVNADGTVTVSVHPRVSSVADSSGGGVPNIQQREATTIVQLRDNQTLVIGGLIQDSDTRTVTKIPFLGDLPLVGRFFQNVSVNNSRNELIIAVTPHIVAPGSPARPPDGLQPLPAPSALPTINPQITLTPAPQTHREPIPVNVPTPSVTMTPAADGTTFTYGSPPPPGFNANDAAPRIYFAQFGPTTIHDGDFVHIVVTTSNSVNRVTIGPPGHDVPLAQTSSNTWEARYRFSTLGMEGRGSVNLPLTAYASAGSSVSVQIPINTP